jgi:DNA polymerase III epsilon subunit-like protein
MSSQNNEFEIPFSLSRRGKKEEINVKAIGRRIGSLAASRLVDRPNIGGGRRRGARGLGVPDGDLNPRTRVDVDGDGTIFDGWPGWEQPDPTPSSMPNAPKLSLSSGEKDKKPSFPRKPTYGPFIGSAEERFGKAKTWEEFKEIYDDTEINFFDYETTGLVFDEFREPSANGQPVQFGVVRMKGDKEIARLNLFMNPKEPLGEWSARELKDKDGNQLTDEWLSKQMSMAEAHRALVEFAGEDAIFGVQNAAFDKDVLEQTLSDAGIEWRPGGYLDTKDIADMTLPKWSEENQDGPFLIDSEGNKKPSNGLAAITKYLEVELGEKHHTADADAQATGRVMSAIINGALERDWPTNLLDSEKRKNKLQKDNEKFDAEIKKFRAAKEEFIKAAKQNQQPSLSSGSQERPIIKLDNNKKRPVISFQKNEREMLKKHRSTNYNYGDDSVLGGKINAYKNDWLKGLSSKQIADLIVPDSQDGHFRMWVDDIAPGAYEVEGPRAAFKKYYDEMMANSPWDEVDYSPENVKASRDAVEALLDSSPAVKWAFENHGAPSIGVMSAKGVETYEAIPSVSQKLTRLQNERFLSKKPFVRARLSPGTNLLIFNKRALIDREGSVPGEETPLLWSDTHMPLITDAHIDKSISGTIVHEWGHWLVFRAVKDTEQGKKNRTNFFGSGNINDDNYLNALLLSEYYKQTDRDLPLMKLWDDKVPVDETNDVPRVITSYGHTNPAETFAEGVVAYFHPNKEVRKNAINEKLRKDIESFLGDGSESRPWDDNESLELALSSGRTSKQRSAKREINSAASEQVFSSSSEEDRELARLDYSVSLSSGLNVPASGSQKLNIVSDLDNRENDNFATPIRTISFRDESGKNKEYVIFATGPLGDNVYVFEKAKLDKYAAEKEEMISLANGVPFEEVGISVISRMTEERDIRNKKNGLVGVMSVITSSGEDSTSIVNEIAIDDKHKRRGLASALFKYQRDFWPDQDLHHSSALSDDGRAFAAATQFDGTSNPPVRNLQEDLSNFVNDLIEPLPDDEEYTSISLSSGAANRQRPGDRKPTKKNIADGQKVLDKLKEEVIYYENGGYFEAGYSSGAAKASEQVLKADSRLSARSIVLSLENQYEKLKSFEQDYVDNGNHYYVAEGEGAVAGARQTFTAMYGPVWTEREYKAFLKRQREEEKKKAKRIADGASLSSGAQPKINLSDDEKREIIRLASQRKDNFSRSVVAQYYKNNGQLSNRQWAALNRMTSRGALGLSSGMVSDEEILTRVAKSFERASLPEEPSTPIDQRLIYKLASEIKKKDGTPVSTNDFLDFLLQIAQMSEDKFSPHPGFNSLEEEILPIESLAEIFKGLGHSRVEVAGSPTKKILGPVISELADLAGDDEFIQAARDYALPPLDVWASAAAKSIIKMQELRNDLGESRQQFMMREFRQESINGVNSFVLRDINDEIIMSVPIVALQTRERGSFQYSRLNTIMFEYHQATPGIPFMTLVKKHMFPDDPAEEILADSKVMSANGDAATGGRNMAEAINNTKLTPLSKFEFSDSPAGNRVREMFQRAYANVAHHDEFARRYAVRVRTLLLDAGIDPDRPDVKRALTVGWKQIPDTTEEPPENGGRFVSAALLVRNLVASLYRPSWDNSGETYTTPHEFMHLITGQGFTRHGEMASNIGWLGAFGEDVWPQVANLLGAQQRFFELQVNDSANGDTNEGYAGFRSLVLNKLSDTIGRDALDKMWTDENGILRYSKSDGLFDGFNWIDPLVPLEASDLGWGLKLGQAEKNDGPSLSSGADRELNIFSKKIDADIVSSAIAKNKRINTLRKERIKDLKDYGYRRISEDSIEEQDRLIELYMDSSYADGELANKWKKKPYPVLTDMEKSMNIPENIIPLSEIEKEAKKLGIRIRNPRHDISIRKRQAVVEPFNSDAYEEEYKRIYEKYENMLKNNDIINDWSDLEILAGNLSFEILDDDIELNETNNSESARQKARLDYLRLEDKYGLTSLDSISVDEQEELITRRIKSSIRFGQYFDLTRKFSDRAEFDYESFEEEDSIGTRIWYNHELLKRKPASKGRNKRVTDGLSLSSGANDKFKEQLKLIDDAVSRSSSKGVTTSSYQQKDVTKELVDEVEKATLDIQNTIRLITERIDEQLDEAYDGNLPEAQKQARIDELLEELESVSKVQESSRLAYQTLEKLQNIFDENRRNLDPSLNPWPPGIHISRNKDGEITGIALTAISNAPISGEYSKRWNNIGDVSDGRVLSIDYLVSLHKEEGTGRTMLGTILNEAKNNNVSLIQIEATNSSGEYWNKFGFSNPKRNNDWAMNGALPSYSFLPIETQKETDDK